MPALILLFLFALSGASAQAPLVRKIEPPNWWTNFTPELTLLLTGENLSGARVESAHLGYLHDLGVTTLWLTPVWKNTDYYHGYHVVDFYALDDHMGSMREYQDLVVDAHPLGIKVLIDYVANHTGPHHPWANDPPTTTWFHGSPAHHLERYSRAEAWGSTIPAKV
jgi:glycosidase